MMKKPNVCWFVMAYAVLLGAPVAARPAVVVGVTVGFAPPVLPVYAQPPCPAPGYLWTPGYWAYDPAGGDYYWVPGTWVLAAYPGMLWTPGYWAFANGVYGWHSGYWGPHVGFYGGINYGFGYAGRGFAGGYWRGGAFYYNRAAANVNVSITNVYRQPVGPAPAGASRASFNGGPGGIALQPTAQERAFADEPHREATAEQQRHDEAAREQPSLHASANLGVPPVAATAHPSQFSGRDVVAAHAQGAARHGGEHANAAHGTRHQPSAPAHGSGHESAPRHHESAPRHDRHAALRAAPLGRRGRSTPV